MRNILTVIGIGLATITFSANKASAVPIDTTTADSICKTFWQTRPDGSRLCTYCEKSIVGVWRCHWIHCRGNDCEYIVVRKLMEPKLPRPLTGTR
jgi:hypothetical protein